MEPLDGHLSDVPSGDGPRFGVHVSVGPLRAWPDEQVQRAYRLSVIALRTAEGGDPAGLRLGDADDGAGRDAREDAERYGLELVRRGLL